MPDIQTLLSLFNSSKYTELVRLFESSGFQSSDEPVLGQIFAASYFRLGQYSKCMSVLEGLESALSDSPEYLSLYGATCRRLGLLAKAREYLGRACSLDPSSLPFKNNFANCLIDLGEYSEARSLLDDILSFDPNYSDAAVNLNRLNGIELNDESKISTSATNPNLTSINSIDPLAMAFSQSEVAIDGMNIRPGNASAAKKVEELLPSSTKEGLGSDHIQLAAKAISDQKPLVGLEFCSTAHNVLGSIPEIYVNASDAYLQLKSFHEAELCLIHAMLLGEPSVSNYVNLVSLLSLRGDIKLAYKYLDRAFGLFPSNPLLLKLKQSLPDQCSSPNFIFSPVWKSPELKDQEITLQKS